MTSAAVIQVLAFGPQDKVIRKNPEFTIWKAAHIRYTNYSTDWQDVAFQNSVKFGANKATAQFVRYADLIEATMLELTLPAISGYQEKNASDEDVPVIGAYWVNAIGFAAIKEVKFEIGGTEIDTLTTEDLFMYDELFNEEGRKLGELIGKFDYSSDVEKKMIEFASRERKLYIPLPFYNYVYGEKSLAVPICSLTRHELKIHVAFNPLAECCVSVFKEVDDDDLPYELSDHLPIDETTSTTIDSSALEARLLVSYVYITDDERDAFTDQELHYLIVQNQHMPISVVAGSTRSNPIMSLAHPVTFQTWRFRPSDWATEDGRRRYSVGFKDRFDYSMKVESDDATLVWEDAQDPFKAVQLKFNNSNRWPQEVDPVWYRLFQSQNYAKCKFKGFEYLYCYAAKVFEYNPTSTANYSKIDNMSFHLEWQDDIPQGECHVQVANYNQIIIRKGLLGMRFID